MAKRTLFLAAAALAPAAMTTCTDIDYRFLVYPDGSGRMVLKLRVKVDGGRHDSAEKLLADMTTLTEGFTAWAEPELRMERDAGETYAAYVLEGYFDDITKVRYSDNPMKEGAPKERWDLRFELVRTDKERVLTIHDRRIEEWQRQASRRPPTGTASERDDLYKGSISVPGRISEAAGFHDFKDRTATFGITEKDIDLVQKGDAQANRRIDALSPKATLRWPKDETPAEDVKAFKKELESAKAKWKKMQPRIRELVDKDP